MSVFKFPMPFARCEKVLSGEMIDSCVLAAIQDLPFKLKKSL